MQIEFMINVISHFPSQFERASSSAYSVQWSSRELKRRKVRDSVSPGARVYRAVDSSMKTLFNENFSMKSLHGDSTQRERERAVGPAGGRLFAIQTSSTGCSPGDSPVVNVVWSTEYG